MKKNASSGRKKEEHKEKLIKKKNECIMITEFE